MGFCASGAFALALLLFGPSAMAQSGIVTVKAETVSTRLIAYGRVVPIALARLRAAEPGVIAGLDVVPGQTVAAGEMLGRLTGPEVTARMAARRAAVAGAEATLRAAEQFLVAEREKRSAHLATRQAVSQAEAAVEDAKARLATATAALDTAKSDTALRAPASGTVVALAAADGERIAAGQTALTVEPEHHLWLKAVYYGSAAGQIRRGMSGTFTPADGSTPVRVKVVSVLSTMQPDGGVPAGLMSEGKSGHWVSGETGTVTLKGTPRSGVMVPTRALILDRGLWWVLVRTPRGDIRQTVTLGPSRGDHTLIEHGLEAGAEVVVANAYLEFHRNVSQRYQPPD